MRKARSGLLDCIRAVAIIMVVFFHVATRHPGPISDFEAYFLRWGSKGVDIFFPLSGFLICSFLLQSSRPDYVKIFFMRRVFRILPLYIAAVTLAAAAMFVTGTDRFLLDRFWINYSFLTAWFIHFQGPGVVPYTITWSLSVEEFAYVIFGVVAWLGRRHLPALLIVFSILPLFLKYWMVGQGQGFYFLPIARIDSIALGGVAAWLMITDRRPLVWLPLAFALSWSLSNFTTAQMAQTLPLTTLALGVCIVMVAISKWASSWDNLVIRAGASIGFYSYFTYLIHIFVIEAIYLVLPHLIPQLPPFWVMAPIALLLTHAAAMISYRWFEGPLIRYGRSLERPAPPQPHLPQPHQAPSP